MRHDLSLQPDAPDAPSSVDEIIAAYMEASDAGEAGDHQDWLRRFPEAAAALSDFFADQDRFTRKIAPLRQCLSGAEFALPAGPLPAIGARLGNYELIEEIARGGMGVVFKARQVDLDRLVAVKMILRGGWSSEAEQQRFRQEAEAVARLDHPHIVPIHEIGTWRDQPYFSMRFIDGGSLADWIAAYQSRHADWGQMDLQAAAGLIAAVARAVHYAHQRGILHRDVKPANILLQFHDPAGGDLRAAVPLVTDFGLAKRVGGGSDARPADGGGGGIAAPSPPTPLPEGEGGLGIAAPSPPTPLPEGEGGLTQTGVAVGTPSYMAPEQAPGAASGGELTTAVDVYSLGAVLYELLAGAPPFRAATVSETLRQVVEQPAPSPRQRNRMVPADLEMICLKCLEKDPARRYGSAEALAADLERFLHGEPVDARPLGPIGRLLSWQRRQPALAAAASLAVVGLVSLAVVSTLFAFSEYRGRAALKKVADDLEISLAEQSRLAGERQIAFADAERHRNLAEENYRKAHQAVEDFYVGFSQKGLSKQPGLQPMQKEMMSRALVYFQDFLAQKADDPARRLDVARTLVRVGDINSLLGAKTEALASYGRAIAMTEQLLRDEPTSLEAKRWQALGCLNRGVLLVGMGRHADAVRDDEKSADLFRALLQADGLDPQTRLNLATLRANMGDLYRVVRQFDKARAALAEARLVLRPLLDRDADNPAYLDVQANILVNLGTLEQALGNMDQAFAHFDEAGRVYDTMLKRRPADRHVLHMQAVNQRRLAIPLNNRGQVKEGLPLLEKSKAALETLVRENPDVPDYLVDWSGTVRALGDFERGKKAYDKALKHYKNLGDRLEDAGPRFKDVAPVQNELAHAYFAVATVQLKQKNPADALKNIDRSLAIRKHATGGDASFQQRQEMSSALVLRGEILTEAGKLDEAIQSIRAGITLIGENAKAAPLVPLYAETLQRDYNLLAKLQNAHAPADALATWQEAEDAFTHLAAQQPDVPALRRRLARILVDYGFDLRTHQRLADSRDRLARAIAILDKLLADSRKETLAELAYAHFQLALTHTALEEHDLEIAHYEKACSLQRELIELDPKPQAHSSLGTYLNNLGLSSKRRGQLDKAEATLRLAVKHQRQALDTNRNWLGARRQLSEHLVNLGGVLRKSGKLADAVDAIVQRRDLWLDQAGELFAAARDLGYCANDLGRGQEKLTAAEMAERNRIADLAVETLRQAVAAGWAEWTALDGQPAFEFVRTRPGFQKLVKEARR